MKKKSGGLVRKINFADAVIVFILLLFTCLALYPFIYTVAGSFNDGIDFEYGGIWFFPRKFTLANYQAVFFDDRLYRAFLNTVVSTVAGVAGGLIFTSCVAYAMSHNRLKGKKIFWTINMITMFFGGGLIPFVLVVQSLHLLNSYFALVVPFAVNSFNLILLRNFIRALPYELVEAAKIDGSSEIRILFSIIIPLSVPAQMTIGLYYAVGLWNDWYWPMIFLEDTDKYPLALALRSLIINSSGDLEIEGGYTPLEYLDSKSKEAAVVMISIIPMIAVYPFVQKFFVKGMVLGAVKG